MRRFWSIVTFDLRFYFGRISTHVYCVLFAFFGLLLMAAMGGAFTEASVSIGGSDGKVFINSPYIIAMLTTVLSMFATMVTAAVAGNAGQRDFGTGMYPLFFTTPLKKWEYLGGRYVASVLVNLYIYLGIGLGLALGSLFPFIEPGQMGPFKLEHYLAPYLAIVGPNILLTCALFLLLAALTRRMLLNYVGGALMVVGFMVAGNMVRDLESKTLGMLLDPFGLRAMFMYTEYFTSFEKNTRMVLLDGDMLTHRLLWLGVGLLITLPAYLRFRFDHTIGDPRRTQKGETHQQPALEAHPPPSDRWQQVTPVYSRRAIGPQLLTLTRRAIQDVITNVYFIAILSAGLIFMIPNAQVVGKRYGTEVLPVTYHILEVVGDSFALFVLLIITFYAGELVWRERDLRIDQVVDAAPVRTWLPLLAKLLALGLITVLLLTVLLGAGIVIQLSKGYTHIELGLYLKTLYLIQLPDYLLLCALAMAVHVIANHKYTGHLVMVVYYGLYLFKGTFGLEHNLWVFGSGPSVRYSDMNLYGPFLEPLRWFQLTWAGVALFLAVLSNLLWSRGQALSFRQRLYMARSRAHGFALGSALLGILVAVGAGGVIYYNVNVKNVYRNSDDQFAQQASYEKRYKQYETLPQPRIVGSSVRLDLFPAELSMHIRGELRLKNKTHTPIETLHLRMPEEGDVEQLEVDGGWQETLIDEALLYRIYTLETPLLPDAETTLHYAIAFPHKGFQNDEQRTMVAQNGSFVHSDRVVPGLGYSREQELVKERDREHFGLPPRARMADLDDPAAVANSYITHDADFINFEAIVCTDPDQTALAPGYLQRTWEENGRRCFHYKMDAPILNFYSFLSARYAVARDRWKNVAIEIYYHEAHPYNIERMIEGVKSALDVFTEVFGPYQYRQLRILEFPRYQNFAQSFPNTIPYSENLGFIAKIGEDNVDYVYYITAHEVAHQWWAHQIIGADAQGATVLSETLAQYSALLVMERTYGPHQLRKFLTHELHGYLQGRANEKRAELPLLRVENQGYIHYQKGGIILWALRDYLGEDAVNRAIRKVLEAHRFKGPPYPTSRALLDALRAETPPEYQYLLEDFFETITLFDLKTSEATWKRLEDGRYEVTLQIEARKLRADDQGKELEQPLEMTMDIGVFLEEGEGEEGEPLYLAKHPIVAGKQTITVVVGQEPYEAGVDPYHKLIDRHPKDNITGVEGLEEG